jgi:hypothetical protein
VVALRGLVVVLPLVGRVPDHPPEAVQLCAPFELQFKVTASPFSTALLVATSVIAGCEAVAALAELVPDSLAVED